MEKSKCKHERVIKTTFCRGDGISFPTELRCLMCNENLDQKEIHTIYVTLSHAAEVLAKYRYEQKTIEVTQGFDIIWGDWSMLSAEEKQREILEAIEELKK